MNLACQLEAVLFYRSEPIPLATLAKILAVSDEEIRTAAQTLGKSLAGRGVSLVENNDTYCLATASEASDLIEKITKEELARDIGKAGLETLAIVLYEGSVSRAEIDYIRGVNSSFILRHLLVRGLVLRENHPTDQRSFIYKPSIELLALLGVENSSQLPEFTEIEEKIKNFMLKPETEAKNE